MTDVVDELRKQAWRRARRREARRACGRRGQGGQGQQVRAAQEPPRTSLRPRASRRRGWLGGQAPVQGLPARGAPARRVQGRAAARRRGSGWSRGSPAPAAPGSTRSRSSPEGAAPQGRYRQGRGVGISNARVEAINNKIKLTVGWPTASGTSTTSWRWSCQVLEPPDRASRALDPYPQKPRSLFLYRRRNAPFRRSSREKILIFFLIKAIIRP